MKFIIILLSVFVSIAIADQRFETVGGFCHFVTPEGFATANDNNEIFTSNCVSSIRQNADATGSGSTQVKVEYPANSFPFIGKHKFSGTDTGVDCVMVDSNGTTYVTQDWTAVYDAYVEGLDQFKAAYGTDSPEFDYNNDGFVNSIDLPIFKQNAKGEITYTLMCRNGAQQ